MAIASCWRQSDINTIMNYRPIFPKIYYEWVYGSLVAIPVKSGYSLSNQEGIILREIKDYKKFVISQIPLQVFRKLSLIFCNKYGIEQKFLTFTDYANKFISIFNYRFGTHPRFGNNPQFVNNGIDFSFIESFLKKFQQRFCTPQTDKIKV